jgi:hypothetical protein
MNLTELPAELALSLLAILTIAATGCIAALHSWTRITAEQKGVKDAESKLISDDAWNDAYPHDKLKLATWLRLNGIKPDSHLGDFIRTCWSAWLGGRPASLTELHVLVARRERSHNATRLSAGIAALLLVCGIVGTLSAIKPVLGDFRFDPIGGQSNTEQPQTSGAETNAGDTDASTDRVNKLIHDLGDAFWPSLAALLGTILVVSCRGLYSLSLHKFTLDLDRFAVDTLIPRYRVPSLSEQYQEVKATLTSVTESLLQREGRFHEAVQQLENLVAGISPALSGLNTAAVSTKEATEALASGATSITEALNRNLGAKSSIHKAIKGLDSVFEKTEQSLTTFASVVESIGESNIASRQGLELAIQTLAQSVGQIAADHQTHQAEADVALREFKGSLTGIPATIAATSKQAVDVGIASLKSSVAQLNDEQRKWHAASTEDLKAATIAGLTGVTKAGENLAAQAEKIASAASDFGNIKTDARVAFKNLADTGQAQIAQIGGDTKSKIDAATEALTKETIKIGTIVDDLSKARLELAPISDARRDVSIAGWRSGNQSIGIGGGPQPRRDEAPQPMRSVSTNPEPHAAVPSTEVAPPPPVISPSNEPSQAAPTNNAPPLSLPEHPQQAKPGRDHVVPAANGPEPIPVASEKKWWNPFTGRKR